MCLAPLDIDQHQLFHWLSSRPAYKGRATMVEVAMIPTSMAWARTFHRDSSIGFSISIYILPPTYTSQRRYCCH